MTDGRHKELDARGLNCPLPILKAKKALAEMASGELLKVVSTDPDRCATSRPSPARPATNSSSRPSNGGDFVHVLRRR
jgi:tRNA 2-thiouridine synthesizing protein A